MGKGITTRSGADPLVQWAFRIENFDSPELSAALRAFLGGEPVESKDGELEISDLPLGANKHRITLRIPGAPYVADVVVQALDSGDVTGAEADPRSAIPSPDGWITGKADSDATWELFNCILVSLQSRENKP